MLRETPMGSGAFTKDQLLLTPEEAARALRVGRTTVYALMKIGDLRAVHIGRSCRISQAELDRYVRRLEASPSRPHPSLDAALIHSAPATPARAPRD